MEIERPKGVSVGYQCDDLEYNGYLINLLDTPGHKDFAEDTYRTDGCDSVVGGGQCERGGRADRRLMEVISMRKTPSSYSSIKWTAMERTALICWKKLRKS